MKDKGDVFDVSCTNPFNVFPIQDTHAIGSGINLDKEEEPEVQQRKWNTFRMI